MSTYVSHLYSDGEGGARCGTRMFTFWSGCWSDKPTCKRCQKIDAAQRAKKRIIKRRRVDEVGLSNLLRERAERRRELEAQGFPSATDADMEGI